MKQIIKKESQLVGGEPVAYLFYKCRPGFEHGTTENKSSKRLGWDLNLRPPDYKSSALATLQEAITRKKSPSPP